jgi:phosphohistidine phosphatase
MPRLLLFRHAKAERARAGESDHARALTKDGRADSEAVGRLIAERYEPVDLVLCSDSRRTRETWEPLAAYLRKTPEVRMLRSIYDASAGYLPILNAEGGTAETLLLVGHNPAIHETAVQLAADLTSREGRILQDRSPKAALAVLEFDGTWPALQARQMRLAAFILPERN